MITDRNDTSFDDARVLDREEAGDAAPRAQLGPIGARKDGSCLNEHLPHEGEKWIGDHDSLSTEQKEPVSQCCSELCP